ncbi:hypothetical protein [Schinkia azotoformans]|uniref:hypothetical protein n=1 Tax=Schinkia azotoformans TaxID=1454 RepID=UPI002DBBE830|nr:hypothetical protein [Schinkia azotoformans]MEC1714752.1 hypothetical protein [Schinkia azotoformans]MEC1757492.1 hypothetical protein [Schinkia azotoformans]
MLKFSLFLVSVVIAGLLVIPLNGILKRLKHVDESPYPSVNKEVTKDFRAPFLPRNDSYWFVRTFERPRRTKKG